MQTYQRILCATDFSTFSENAARRAVELANCFDAQITLLHVIEYFEVDRSNESIAPEDVDPAKFREEKAKESLIRFAERIGNKELNRQVVFSKHSARHSIADFAKVYKADLIVLGTHGHHGITDLLGSTANGVLHDADCDVLVVRDRS